MDSRYLDGDPREDEGRFLFTDTRPLLQIVEREAKAIEALLMAKRYEESEVVACGLGVRVRQVMRNLETPTLPELDLERTKDATDERARVYKG